MEPVIEVARKLREGHHFRGDIHRKTIPEASPALIAKLIAESRGRVDYMLRTGVCPIRLAPKSAYFDSLRDLSAPPPPEISSKNEWRASRSSTCPRSVAPPAAARSIGRRSGSECGTR